MKSVVYHGPTIPDHSHGDPNEWAAFIAETESPEVSVLDRPDIQHQYPDEL